MKKIKIFLASSEELKQERLELADFVEHLNHTFEKLNINVQLIKWEYLDSSMGAQHKQEDYNDMLRECELCLMLYWTKFGLYTKSELDTAYSELKAGNNPKKLYVYFKDTEGEEKISNELREFRDSFSKEYGHFENHFRNIDTLKSQFLLQFIEYQTKALKDSPLIEVKDGKISLGGKTYVDLMNVPFVGNNDEYTEILKRMEKQKRRLARMEPDDEDYIEEEQELRELEEKKEKMEESLWDTALEITRLSNQRCSERLHRAMDLFNKGDNKGANALLKEEDIDKEVDMNLKLMELGEKGKEGIKININDYKMKVRFLRDSFEDYNTEEIVRLSQKILSLIVKLYGDISVEVIDARQALAQAFAANDNYRESEKEYLKILTDLESLNRINTIQHAEILRELGKLHLVNKMFLRGKPYIVHALDIIEQKYGENHIVFIKALQDISIFYRSMDMFDEAIDASRRALNLLERIPESNESLYNSIRRSLAHAYSLKVKLIKLDDNEYTSKKDKQDSEAALNIFKEIYESEKEDKRASITNLCNLGKFLRNNHGWPLKDNPELLEAVEYYKKALEIAKEINDKRSTDKILKAIGDICELIDAPEKAEELGFIYQKAEPIDGKTFNQIITDRNNIANKIADLYLENYPRKKRYGVTLSSTEDDSTLTVYHDLTDEEFEILQEYSRIAIEEDISLDEILESENPELAEKLIENNSPFPLNVIDSIDFENPLKFTRFSIHQFEHNGNFARKENIGVSLNDDEYKEILVELLTNRNHYSMNMLVYRKPEIAQKIIKHLTWASMDMVFENYNPFVCDMSEQKEICESILNPFKDILDLFNNEDEAIRKFVEKHQIVPECRSNDSPFDNEIYTNEDEQSLDRYHVTMHFVGRKILIHQEGVTRIHGRFHDIDSFIIEAEDVMKKYGLNSPEEIFPYLRTNFNSPDCFYRLHQDLIKDIDSSSLNNSEEKDV